MSVGLTRGHQLCCHRQREPGSELPVYITSNLMAKERKGKGGSEVGESCHKWPYHGQVEFSSLCILEAIRNYRPTVSSAGA